MWQWFLKSAPIMLMHDKVWELLVYDIWEKFLYLPFFSPLFWFPLSYSGHQSFRLWTIWKISVLKDAVGRQGIGSWRKINPSGWIMWVGIGNLLTWKKQVGQCLEIVWRCINTDWQKRVVKKLSYDNQKGISQILLRHLSSPEQRKV